MPKQSRGPFFYYMLEFRRREESIGNTFPGGLKQIAQEASPSWNRLNDAERQIYKNQADAFKNQNQDKGEKYTAQGIPYSLVEKEKQRLLDHQQTIGLVISDMIQTAVHNNALEKMKMYFISVNYFCKTLTEVFIPAELAMVQYTLESGVRAKLHELINPIKLPLGFKLEAKQLSEETHELPIPPNAIGETDLETLLQKMLNFTDYNQKPKKYFPLITDVKEIPVVESILEQCYKDAKIDYNFLVIPLGEFFFHLKRATEKYGLDICTFPSKTIADILLKKDPYEYTIGIGCEFHENLGNTRFCTLSKAVRWTYILSDNCCLDLSIDLVAGCHLPSNADTTLSLNMAETTTCTNQAQSDGLSLVSSVQTNYTLPSAHHKESSSNNQQDEKPSFMTSAAGASNNSKQIVTASANPSHMIDVNDSVYDPNLPRKSTEEITVSTLNTVTAEKREKKDGIIRQPGIAIAGRGRGALMRNAAQPSTSRQTHEAKR